MVVFILIIMFFVHLDIILMATITVAAITAVMFTLLLTIDTLIPLLIAELSPQKVVEEFLVVVLVAQAEVLAEAEAVVK